MSCDIVDDIEDILRLNPTNRSEPSSIDEFNRTSNRSFIVPKLKKKLKKQHSANDKEEENENENESQTIDHLSNVPGVASIYVKTWGCTHNSSDSEYMAGQLASYGYKIVDDPESANLWLLNSCTVKNPAEDHFKNYIEKARQLDKYLVLAGCVPQGAPRAEYMKGLSVIGVQQIDRVIEVVEETLKGNSVRLLGKKKRDNKKYGGASLSLPKVRRNPLIEIIAINTGCLNECTYCKTKHARGELGSYYPDEIVDRIRQSFEEGVVEIWLTSEDTGAYGKDIGVTIVDLLWKIVEHIPNGCMLRIGMTNPPYILEHLEEMAKILQHPRVYSFLHIPVQSGSDAVLADMKREYSSDDFKHIMNFLREKVPGMNIATDLICGFPTETEQDFECSLDLVREYKFSSLFINQFFKRPGTPAAKMHQVPAQERKRRTKLVSELFHSYTTYDHKLGCRFEVLVTELSHDGEYYVAHNKFYDQVLVPKLDNLMGKMFEVEIVECGKHSMKGKLVDESVLQEPPRRVLFPKGEVSGSLDKSADKCGNDSLNDDCSANDSGCCSDGENTCCNNESSCCGGQTSVDACCKTPTAKSPHDNNRLRNYAKAILLAGSIVVLSRVALKVFYQADI